MAPSKKKNQKIMGEGDKQAPPMVNDYHYVVMVEFDGHQPNGTYYDRLHELGIYSRLGNRDEYNSPLARRNSTNRKDNAIVAQEGMFMCKSRDMARTIANIADDAGASMIWTGMMTMDEFRMSEQDLNVWNQYKKSVGRRGPKPAEERGRYTIMCFQEATSFEVELDSIPFTCPSCNSFHFRARRGQKRDYAIPANWDGVDPWEYWQATRFGKDGQFEIPTVGRVAPPETIHPDAEKFAHPFVVGDMPRGFDVFRTWDVCYCLSKFNRVELNEMRLSVLNGYIMGGGVKQYQMFSEVDKGRYDLLDLAILVPELREHL